MNKLSAYWEQGPMKILNCAKTLNDKVKQLQTNENRNIVYIPHLGKLQRCRYELRKFKMEMYVILT
jgi:hypothetical protein